MFDSCLACFVGTIALIFVGNVALVYALESIASLICSAAQVVWGAGRDKDNS